MDSLKKRIIDFLENFIPEYRNPHGATIMLFDDLTLHTQVMYPGYECWEENDLEIICSCDSLEDFFHFFEIKDVKDLGKIKLSNFEKLYEEGKAQVSCMIGDYQLTFEKNGETMDISDCRGKKHKLNSLLITGEEFINYTRNQYILANIHRG